VYQRLGVEPNGESIDIWYLACPGERVDELTLWDLDDDKIAGEEGDVVLWTASAEQLATLDRSAAVPMTLGGPITLEEDGRYFVDVQTSQGAGSSNLFFLDDLELGLVRVDFRIATTEEFRANALKSCPT
jgi:hypothetical protein